MQPIGIGSVLSAAPQLPFVSFEKRAVERRRTVEEGGSSYYEDVDFALITPFGSKDRTEKVVAEWFSRLTIEVKDGRLPQQWLDAFRSAYSAWKNDQAPPVVGTDIRQWPAISPAECKMLVDLHCSSVEALAGANEEFLQRYGMGGRALQQKAQSWLTAQKDHGPIVARIAALEAASEGLKSQIDLWRSRAQAAEMALQMVPQAQPLPYAAPSVGPAPKDNTEALIADGIEAGFDSVRSE